MTLNEQIISILSKHPADQYLIHRNTQANMNQVTRAIAELQQKHLIHVAKYRKSKRTGVRLPVYSLGAARRRKLDLQSLLAGVTSERSVEYDFVSKNMISRSRKAKILDIGAAGSGLSHALRDYGKNWEVFGMDLEPESDLVMDVRMTGFRSGAFDLVISVSTIEHVGLDVSDERGDEKAIEEIFRILKKGCKALITVPYGNQSYKSVAHRVYNSKSLARLASLFKIAKEEYYIYRRGKWVRCGAAMARNSPPFAAKPLHFHSNACVCLVLQKR